MRAELAEQLIETLMGWDVPRFTSEALRVQALAAHKYDEYGQYRAGVKFAESLAVWLEQLEPSEREIAFEFVMERLIFISDAEMSHLIDVAYADVLEPLLLSRTAAQLGEPTHRVRHISDQPEFRARRRRVVVLGLSDGARLDRLRRAAPSLSHEQFCLDIDLDEEQAARMQAELAAALEKDSLPGEATFRQIVLVDDFAGSGRTLLREDPDNAGDWKGKLWRFRGRLEDLGSAGLLANDAEVSLLLYSASQEAIEHLKGALQDAGLGNWTLHVIQPISDELRVDRTDSSMADLCRTYYDPSTKDKHKADTPLGYKDCALPVVFSQNSPNNSVCLIWAETSSEGEGLGRRALFPRYERHHRDRP